MLRKDQSVATSSYFEELACRNIKGSVAVVTGANSGIAQATARDLVRRGARGVALVDIKPEVEEFSHELQREHGGAPITRAFVGNVACEFFCQEVMTNVAATWGTPRILFPCAGITYDQLTVRFNKESQSVEAYPSAKFNEILSVNLIAPAIWSKYFMELIFKDRRERGLGKWNGQEEPEQGVIIVVSSVSAQGNRGQTAYSASKGGLVGLQASLNLDGAYCGVRCGIIFPGYTDTPMTRVMDPKFLAAKVLPQVPLGRLIQPHEIAEDVCYMINHEEVTEVWADGGFRPMS